MNNDLEQFSEDFLNEMIVGGLSAEPSNREVSALARIVLSVKQAKPAAYLYHYSTSEGQQQHLSVTEMDISQESIIKNKVEMKPLYTTPQPAHTEQDGWISIPKEMLADYRDVKNSELQTYKASFGSHCDIPGSRWQRDLADLTEELAEIDKLIAAAPKPESE